VTSDSDNYTALQPDKHSRLTQTDRQTETDGETEKQTETE